MSSDVSKYIPPMVKIPKLTLSILPDKLAICFFEKNNDVPSWAMENNKFYSVTKTLDELSIVCPQDNVPAGVMAERGWRAFKLETVLDMSVVGIVASLANPLAEAGISIFYISTYKTNYLLVEEADLEKAVAVLGKTCEIKK